MKPALDIDGRSIDRKELRESLFSSSNDAYLSLSLSLFNPRGRTCDFDGNSCVCNSFRFVGEFRFGNGGNDFRE